MHSRGAREERRDRSLPEHEITRNTPRDLSDSEVKVGGHLLNLVDPFFLCSEKSSVGM